MTSVYCAKNNHFPSFSCFQFKDILSIKPKGKDPVDVKQMHLGIKAETQSQSGISGSLR